MSATRRLEFIARTQLTGAAASVSFATGLSGFTKFFVVCYIVNDADVSGKRIRLRFNNDSGANYADQGIVALNASIFGQRETAQTQILLNPQTALTQSQTFLSVCEISKPVAGEVARVTFRTGYNNTIVLEAGAGEWTNTAALINRIDILPDANNFDVGTRILLYGSKD